MGIGRDLMKHYNSVNIACHYIGMNTSTEHSVRLRTSKADIQHWSNFKKIQVLHN